jgi:hypothetical protein
MRTVGLILFILMLLLVGSYAVFFGGDIQARAVRDAEVRRRPPSVQRFNRSKQYLFAVRSAGIIAYLMCALAVFALLKGVWE